MATNVGNTYAMTVPWAVTERKYHSGSGIHGSSGLRITICQAPSTKATANKPKASQKWARISCLLFNTAHPFRFGRQRCERRLVDDLDLSPHAFMADAAELLTGHQMLAGSSELRCDHRDIARDEHLIHIGAFDQYAVDDIRAGRPNGQGRVGRHHDARRREGIALPESTYSDRAVGLDYAS